MRVCEYDLGGNILNKKRYDYTTGAVGTVREIVTYIYGDSNWKDKLTQYSVQVGTNPAASRIIRKLFTDPVNKLSQQDRDEQLLSGTKHLLSVPGTMIFIFPGL